MLKRLADNTIIRLISGVIIGLLVGPYLNDIILQIILSTKHILGRGCASEKLCARTVEYDA